MGFVFGWDELCDHFERQLYGSKSGSRKFSVSSGGISGVG